MTLLRKIQVLFTGLVFLGVCTIQAQTVWTARYNGADNGLDLTKRVITDNVGFVYVAGTSYATNTANDYVVIKYEPDGTPSGTWPDVGHGVGVRRFDMADDHLQGLAVDGQGNVFVTGYSITNYAPSKTYTVKYDSNGNQAWAVPYKFYNTAFADIKVDGDGNSYLIVPVISWNGPESGTYIVKYTPQGTLSSSWPYDGTGVGMRRFSDAQARGFAVSPGGDVSVFGVRPTPGVTSSVAQQIVNWKYNAQGDLLWSSVFDTSSTPYDYPSQVDSDADGNTYVAGTGAELPNKNGDYLLMKLDPSGTLSSTWPDEGAGVGVRRYNRPGSTNNTALTMQLDDNGNIVVSGLTQGVNGVIDLMTVKYDASGTLSSEWTDLGTGVGVRTYNVSSLNTNLSMQVDHAGSTILAVRHAANQGEFRVLEYSAAGVFKLLGTFNGPTSGNDEPRSLALDALGNAFVTGISSGYGTSADIITQGYYRNGAPVAVAGADQTLEAGSGGVATVQLDGSASSDPDSDPLTYTWSGDFGSIDGVTATVSLGLGSHAVTLTVSDGKGGVVSDTATVVVQDTIAPTVSLPADYAVSLGTDGQAAIPDVTADTTASDTVTPSSQLVIAQTPAAGTLVGIGVHEIHVTVTDSSGNVGETSTFVYVADTSAPVISNLTASPSVLSPANGKLIAVTLTADVTDNHDATVTAHIISVTSNETLVEPGSRKSDYEITGDMTLNLRAKSDTTAGRIYYVTVQSSDSYNNVATATLAISVDSGTTSGGGGGGKGGGGGGKGGKH